jgi:hypothetical protein
MVERLHPQHRYLVSTSSVSGPLVNRGNVVHDPPDGGGSQAMIQLRLLSQIQRCAGRMLERHETETILAYVPIHDAPPIERGFVWPETNTTTRVREFVRAATDANR